MMKLTSEKYLTIGSKVINLLGSCDTLFYVQKRHPYENIAHHFCKYSLSGTGRKHGDGLETHHY